MHLKTMLTIKWLSLALDFQMSVDPPKKIGKKKKKKKGKANRVNGSFKFHLILYIL